ncbi:hypothetical protein LXT12_00875 [Pelomonas sp. P7]|uniref:Uncharacterized protein n=1 Tax=Pelomonas caseinilytica TaxID=2906763 RepID=A0ABS8X634_9BURK|nr:hypothetical protein [Pelomonas sp. P7]MCE4535811.1 hypothetical protein [Pelomonas sp. P7]
MRSLAHLSRALAAASLLLPSLLWAARPDPEVLNAIRDQGFNHSQVMQTLQHLTDRIGPRLTNSPQITAPGCTTPTWTPSTTPCPRT